MGRRRAYSIFRGMIAQRKQIIRVAGIAGRRDAHGAIVRRCMLHPETESVSSRNTPRTRFDSPRSTAKAVFHRGVAVWNAGENRNEGACATMPVLRHKSE